MSLLVAAGEVWTNPIIVGLIVGFPSIYFGWRAYLRAESLDRAAARTAELAAQNVGVQTVIDGLNTVIDQLQEDRADLRENLADVRANLRKCRATLQQHFADQSE